MDAVDAPRLFLALGADRLVRDMLAWHAGLGEKAWFRPLSLGETALACAGVVALVAVEPHECTIQALAAGTYQVLRAERLRAFFAENTETDVILTLDFFQTRHFAPRLELDRSGDGRKGETQNPYESVFVVTPW